MLKARVYSRNGGKMKGKKLWALTLAAVLALSSFQGTGVQAKESKYPTSWDLTEVYQNASEWQNDYECALILIQGLSKYKGTLHTAQGIYNYLTEQSEGELTMLENRLYLYAYLGYSLNPSDETYSGMMDQMEEMFSQITEQLSYVDIEIYGLPLAKRQALYEDPLLSEYQNVLKKFIDPDAEAMSEEDQKTMSDLDTFASQIQRAYETLAYVDMPNPTITMPDGSKKELTDGLYTEIIYDDSYSRAFKKYANETLLTRPVKYTETYADLLNSELKAYWAEAKLCEYDSSLEAKLDADGVDEKLYQKLIETAHAGIGDYQRYLAAHKRGLHLEEQYPFDTADSVSDYDRSATSYDDAVDEVRETLSVLGEDYIAAYDDLVTSNHQDVYPTDTKTTGAYSMSVGKEYKPYALFNYYGYTDDVSTLAHEFGHSLYSYYSQQNQKDIYVDPTIFTQEVASTTNELLYYNYKMNHAQSDEERLFYLENILSMYSGTFFTQVMFTEFEDSLYKTVESGESLDVEKISDKWTELYQEYRGDTITWIPNGRYQWTAIPHLYYNYYMYQYATSVTYAAAMSQRILSGDQEALTQYKNFLAMGSSKSPVELLQTAGIDPYADETYEYAMSYYSGLVDEYERLVAELE